MQLNTTNPTGSAEQPAGRVIPTDRDALILTVEAASLLGLDRRTLDSWRLRGGGPRFIRISARAVRYRRADLMEWIEARVVASTSDPDAAG